MTIGAHDKSTARDERNVNRSQNQRDRLRSIHHRSGTFYERERSKNSWGLLYWLIDSSIKKMTRVRNNGTLRSTSSSSAPDPALLLARGYTARHVGAVLQRHGTVNPLTPQEMEHDLQHIVAYQEAAARYHQITYATTNRLLDGTSANGGASGIVQHAAAAAILQEPLPVKIDPDQEKRAAAQRKRMQRAEAVREELEQQYVALRAHYVRTTQQLQQVQDDSLQTIEFLQRTIQNVARAMGLQRVRLQIVRDVLAALRVRNRNDETSTAMQEENHPDSSPCPMAAFWGQLEEDIRKVCWMQKQQQTTTTRKSSKTQSVLAWHSTKEPSTIQGVPQLVSNISTVPDKSIGITTSGTFGALSSSLLWFEAHLPSPSSSALDAENAALEAEALALETELQKEREFNQRVLDDSGRARNQHDQWVAMISLVRQETEAVIHRHNVLLECDEVQKAIKEAPSTEGGEDEEEEDDDLDEGAGDEENVVDAVPAPPPPQPAEGADEEANEADDEGMVEDEEESETNGKRISAAEEEAGPRKRRKL